MSETNLRLLSEHPECLHGAANIAGPDGAKHYGLPISAQHCIHCAWVVVAEMYPDVCEMPTIQMYWVKSDAGHQGQWGADAFHWEDEGAIFAEGRGATQAEALYDMAEKLRTSLRDQRQ